MWPLGWIETMTVGAVSLSIRPASHISRRRGMAGSLGIGRAAALYGRQCSNRRRKALQFVVNAIERLLTALKEPK